MEQLEGRVVPDSGGAAGVLTSVGNLQLNPSGQATNGFPQVIPNVKVQLIFLSDPTHHTSIPAATQTAIKNFFTAVTSDGHLAALLGQYGNTQGLPAIGNGSVGVIDTKAAVAPDTTVTANGHTYPAYSDNFDTDDHQLQTIIQAEINNGNSAPSDGLDNLYFIFTPPGDAVVDGNTSNSVTGFGGYHTAFLDANGTNEDYYAVIPDESSVNVNDSFSGLNAVQGETEVASHETAEAVTDCTPVTGWADPFDNLLGDGEVADQAANETYVEGGHQVQYLWSNALAGPAHAPGTGADDLFINQVTPPAVPVSVSTSVPVATFTAANTSLTASNFSATVFNLDSTGHGRVNWTVTSITGGAGHFVVNAKPNAAVTAGTYGKLYSQQEGLYVVVQDTSAADATAADGGAPTSNRYAPYVVANTAPLTYTADSGSGVNHFVLKENPATGNFELRDNGNLVFTQPIALTTGIHISADPEVPGAAGASVDSSLTIDYTGGRFTNAVTFDGGPGGGTHTLTFTGGAFTNETYTYIGAAAGSVNLDGQVVTFSHTSALANGTTVTNDTFNLPGVGNSVTLQESGSSGTPLELLSGGTFPTTQFASPGGSLTIASASGTTNAITVTGTLTDLRSALSINGNSGSDTVNLNGALTLGNAGGNTGNLSVTAQVISVTGSVDATAGTSGTMTLHSGTTIATSGSGLLRAKALALQAGGAIGSAGTPLAIDAGTLTADSSAGNGNQFLSDSATVKVSAANGLNAGTGTIALAGGTFLIDGSTASSSPVVVASGATLGGTGTVGGAVTVNSGGTVSPGDGGPGALGTGSLTVKAGGTYRVAMRGKAVGSGYDQLNVHGTATLGGTISVSLLNGFQPSAGDSYHALTFTSKSGDFTTQTGFNLGGGLALQEQFSPSGSPTTLNLVVNAATGASHFGVTASAAAAVAGTAVSVTVTALDGSGNVATGYTGTVHFSSSDVQAGLSANYTFTAADHGAHTFTGVVLRTAGPQTVTATDQAVASVTGTGGPVTVSPAAVDHLGVTAPTAEPPGTPFSITVTAQDAFNNTVPGYAGTVGFTSSDPNAVLPSAYTFTAGDAGVHTFSGVTLSQTGNDTITATDQGGTVKAGTATVTVASAVAALHLAGFTTTTAGLAGSMTVTAVDAHGTPVPSYTGTVTCSSSDQQAGLPANYTFTAADGGAHTFSVTLKTAGNQSLTVTDTGNPSLTASLTGIAVSPAAASALHVAVSPTQPTAGTPATVAVTAVDPYGNTATGYRGTVTFSSSDGQAALPAAYPFTAADAGTHTFSVTFNTGGSQSLSVADGGTPPLGGSANVTVQPSSPGVTESFDTTAVGALPAGWAQWSSTGQTAFAVTTAESLSAPNGLGMTASSSSMAARAWVTAPQPADVQVSASVYLNSLIPAQVLARGANLNGSTPSYYAVAISRGLQVQLLRVVNGVTTSLATLSPAGYVSSVWVRVTLSVVGTQLQAQVYRVDKQQYLTAAGQWQSAPAWALSATDTTLGGPGLVGLARQASYTGTVVFDDFAASAAGGGQPKPPAPPPADPPTTSPPPAAPVTAGGSQPGPQGTAATGGPPAAHRKHRHPVRHYPHPKRPD